MAAGVQNAWDTTANNNATADSNINWAEGQAPSTVNNSARAMMAAVAKLRKDIAGMLVTAGTSTAYTLTTNETLTLADGVTVTCRMSATNGASPTLNVDSTGAVAIQGAVGTAIPTGALLSGAVYEFTYYASSAAWLVRGFSAIDAGSAVSRPYAAGTVSLFGQTSAPTGWTKDTSLDGAAIRLTNGSVGDGGSVDFDTAFSSSRTISQANLPSYNLGFTLNATNANGSGVVRAPSGLSQTVVNVTASTAVLTPGNFSVADISTYGVTGTISSGGSGTGMNFQVKYAKVIRATID